MNRFSGTIKAIHTAGSLSQLQVQSGALVFTSIVIETPQTASYLEKGKQIEVIFKETEVILSSALNPRLSVENQICGRISQLEKGALLSRYTLDTPAGKICAVITNSGAEKLNLKPGDEATAMIKTTEIMLSQ